MRLLIRFLLWMLIAALPLQGNAFAGIPCAAMSAPGNVALNSQVNPGGQHCIEMANGGEVGDVAEPAAQSGGEHHCAGHADGGHPTDSHGKCSQCASCCTGAFAPPAMPSPVLPAAFSAIAPSIVEAAMIGHVPATPKRPPRLQA